MKNLAISLSLLLLAAAPLAADEAISVYRTRCAECHQLRPRDDGSKRPIRLVDLSTPDVQKKTDEALSEAIRSGRGDMPAFGAKLTSDEICNLVTYIRSLRK